MAEERTLTPGTLELLHRFYPDKPQDELVRDFRRIEHLLTRQLRASVLDRINDNMHAALVLFCMDLGMRFFEQSTLRHRVNACRFLEAAAQFLPCCSRGGITDRAMKARRHAEASLFCSFLI